MRWVGCAALVLSVYVLPFQALNQNGAEMPDGFVDTLWAVIQRMQVRLWDHWTLTVTQAVIKAVTCELMIWS